MEAGARLGLQARGQDVDSMDAGRRLRYSYDSLAASQDAQRRAQQAAQSTAAAKMLYDSQQDAIGNYQKAQEIGNQSRKIDVDEQKAQKAADALQDYHDSYLDIQQQKVDAINKKAAQELNPAVKAKVDVFVDKLKNLNKAMTASPRHMAQYQTQAAQVQSQIDGLLNPTAPAATSPEASLNGVPTQAIPLVPVQPQFTAGQKAQQGGKTYQFDGTSWNQVQ